MKILITGGHLTPALAFIDYLQTTQKNVRIVFVGREFAREKDKQPAREREAVESRGIKFVPIQAAKFQTGAWVKNLLQLPLFFASFFSALRILSQQQPDVFLSFGGYLSLPMGLASWIVNKPIVVHEQTRAVGLSNQLVGQLAKKVAISFTDSQPYFPTQKTVLTGNLLRQQLTSKNQPKPAWLTSSSELPILYITGGSQGSEVINSILSQTIHKILKDWQVIHQCGTASQERSYLAELEQQRAHLSANLKSRYAIREWVTEQELAWIYQHAAAAVSRAGANTILELTYSRLPAILIPLPFSRNQEQLKNAENLANSGGAIVIAQSHLTPNSLLEALHTIRTKNQAHRRKLESVQYLKDADKKLFDLIKNLLPAKREKKS
ncbi:MAG: hypothetical protein COU66_00650 [Candidatus Pacebacteria bacterium CG10_big_fil_rev_8_21_14_0_10_44_11]|nr:MAG: hypothetical protein COU66_00650 [Candidatus Pacebacteria bacterium CG10_big_fil_rev_8_21_14_0_10_44_11]